MQRACLAVHADAAEDVLDVLLDLIPQGVRDRPDGDLVEIVIYGDMPPPAELEAAAGPALARGVELEEVPGGWQERRARESRPVVISERIRLRRPWDPPGDPGPIDLVIDRGRGFGTGSHPTTAMVLELLCDIEPAGPLVDLGCGGGILSIAAAQLGWGPVTGLDLDDAAVREARENVARNGAEVSIDHADLRTDPLPEAAVVLANVNPLAVHELIAARIGPGTHTVVASGLITQEVEPALTLYGACGLTEQRRLERNGWAALQLGRAP